MFPAGAGFPAPRRGQILNGSAVNYAPLDNGSTESIIKYGFSYDSNNAADEINKALSELGLSDKVEIPDGCWNIAWFALKDTPSSGQFISLGLQMNSAMTLAVASNAIEAYADYTKNTANGHVFWFAINAADTLPSCFKITQLQNMIYSTNNVILAVTSSKPVGTITNIMAQTDSPMVLSQVNFADGYTYTSPDGEEYKTISNIKGTFLFVQAEKTLTPKDVLITTKPGELFTGYTAEPSTYYTEGTYTAPTTKQTVTLTPQFSAAATKSITITQESQDYGTVSTDPAESAAPGVNVTIMIDPHGGYIVDTVKVTYGDEATPVETLSGSGKDWSFVMPEGDVTIDVTYFKVYSVTVNVETDDDVGTVKVSPKDKDLKPGDAVTLTLEPKEGYALETINATYGDGTSLALEGEGNTRTFDMPEGDVTVTVTFKKLTKHTVTIQSPMENGSIEANPTEAYEGQTVTLSIKPKKGYELKSFYLRVDDTKNVEYKSGGVTQITFVMPDGNVTVHATFAEAKYMTAVGTATLWDRPALSGVLYNGHYDDSDSNGKNKMVGEYSISEPTDKGTYQEYTLTARDLHLFASVDRYHLTTGEKEPTNATFGYYVGLTFEPVDGGSQIYPTASYVTAPAESRDGLTGAESSSYTGWKNSNSKVPITVYFELDPENPNREYWFRVSWGNTVGTRVDYICVKVDATYLPITHTYEVPDEIPGGFSGQTTKTTSLGVVNANNFNEGYKDIRTPEQLGWVVPADWTWHWEMDGNSNMKIPSEGFFNDLSKLEDVGSMSQYYDHTFKLVIDNIPTYTVTVTPPVNGQLTLTPVAAEGNKYNFGQTVTVTAVPNPEYDLSSLTVNGENVSTKVYNGEYSFVVTGDTTVSAVFINADSTVKGVTVNGLTASHTGEREWSIVLPWNFSLPDESGSGIRFTFYGSATATLEKVTSDGDKANTYTYKIGEQTYTVKVTVAERRDFKLIVNMAGGSYDAVSGITGTGEDAKVAESTRVELTLKPGFGYALPDSIRVTVGNVMLAPKDYTYNRTTGKVVLPAEKVTGEVVITGSCVYGNVHVEIHAGNSDIFTLYYDIATDKNTQIYNPAYSSDLPRNGDLETSIQQTNIAAAAKMVPSDSQTSSGGGNDGGQSGNPYQWVIPKWLTFDGWYVNQDETGAYTTDPEKYTKLETTNTDGSFPFTPNPKNPNPVITARWNEDPTYTLTLILMPGADDVKYDGPVDDPPPAELLGQIVTEDNVWTAVGKAATTDTLELYIPETYYTREGYHFNQWVDDKNQPVAADEGKITITYDAELGNEIVMVLYAQWAKDSTDYEITVTFEPGEHGGGKTFVTTFDYNIDVGGTMSPQSFRIPTPNDCGFEIEEGWQFTGWKIEGDKSGKVYTDSVSTVEFVEAYPNGATFIAQWETIPLVDIHYTVSPGPGSVTGEDFPGVLKAASVARTITLPTTIEGIKAKFTGWIIPEGVEFLNWTFGDGRIVNEEAGAGQTEAFRPTEGMTITATWTTKDNVDTWQLEFDANGGDEADENDMPTLIHRVEKNNENAEWTVEVGECSFEAPEGMQFSYWTINGKQVSPNSLYTIKESDIRDGKITVKAVWKNIPDTVVKVYFRGGGGTGSMSSDEVKIAWNETSKTYTFPYCDYVGTSANPIFAGWKYTVKGARDGKPFSESDGKIYQPGTVITVRAPSGNETITSIELVAQWKPRTGGGYVPNPGIGGGTGAGTGGAGTAVGKNPVNTPEPDRQPGNGKVDSNVHSANTGETVTVLPTPDSRYMTGKVTVLDKDGNEVDVTWNGDGTYSFEMPEGGVTVTAEFVTPDEVYEDVEAGDWYLADVANAANYGLMTGVSATDFGPDETATRAQMMTILARRNNVPGTWAGGADWYKAGAEWAVNEGISDGTRLFDALTREEIITMLYRYVGSPKVSGSRTATFADANTVDSWAVDAIEWAVEVGIMQGRGNNELAPRDVATRAELAAILSRVMRLVKEF